MTRTPVSLHPYFRVHPGQLETALALLPQFVEKSSRETKLLHYDFTRNGDEIFCREAYEDAEGTLAHLENVGELLGKMLQASTLVRLEIHGPAAELEKLKPVAGKLNPAWFVSECGLQR